MPPLAPTRASRWRHLAPVTAGAVATVYVVLWISAIALAQELTPADRDGRPPVSAVVATVASDQLAAALPVAGVPESPIAAGSPPVEASVPPSRSTTEPVTPAPVAPMDPAVNTPAIVDARTPSMASEYAFLDCVRHRESRGNYHALNPSGAAGAYQLMPVTARQVALRAGRPDLASTSVLNWSAADQDLMALVLLRWQGAAPWEGGC